jgi:hypothetical protein
MTSSVVVKKRRSVFAQASIVSEVYSIHLSRVVKPLSPLFKNRCVLGAINAQLYAMMMPLKCTKWLCEALYSMSKVIKKRKLSEMLALDVGSVFSHVQQMQSV